MTGQGSTDRLLALGAAFAARLETDTGRLHALARTLHSAPPAEHAQVLEEIRELAHRMRGTAPAFDAADIGDAAAALEEAIVDAQDLHPALQQLLSLLDSAIGTHGRARSFRPRL